MIFWLKKKKERNFSVPREEEGLTLRAAGAGRDGGPGCTPDRADLLKAWGWSWPGDTAPHGARQCRARAVVLTRGYHEHPRSPCISEPYPHPTFAVWCHRARLSRAASAGFPQGSPSPPGPPRAPVWGSATQLPGSADAPSQHRVAACKVPAASCPLRAAGKPADP